MQSLSSAPSWPSRDSVSSSHSLLFSESEQTEDEADVFLSEGEGDGGGGGSELDGPRSASPKARLVLGGFGDLAGTPLKRDQLVSPTGGVKTGGEGRTEGDFSFARKCAELQGFVRPLLELLNGLKRGKYDRGLSSFQQSVAMDRIQRIVGVLQNPNMGEKHLHTLQQVEMMLKLWFPLVSPPAPPASITLPVLTENITRNTASRWRRDQLHIPVKKRRMSWMDVDSPNEPAPACKRFQQERPECRVPIPSLESAPAGLEEGGRRCGKGQGKEAHGESRLTPVPHPCKETGGGMEGNVVPPISTKGRPATQDASISSTTPLSPTPNPTPLRCKPTRCESKPIATETEGGRGRVLETSQRQSQSLPRFTNPVKPLEQ